MLVKKGFSFSSANKGKCYLCGRGDHDPQTDSTVKSIWLGVTIDFEGDLDICVYCAQEIGKLAEMVPLATYEALAKDLDDLNNYCADVEEHLGQKTAAVNALLSELGTDRAHVHA